MFWPFLYYDWLFTVRADDGFGNIIYNSSGDAAWHFIVLEGFWE